MLKLVMETLRTLPNRRGRGSIIKSHEYEKGGAERRRLAN
jgi:hypothetical protein